MLAVGGRNRKTRPKSFKTVESAENYADKVGVKQYKLVFLSPKKIRIVKKIKA